MLCFCIVVYITILVHRSVSVGNVLNLYTCRVNVVVIRHLTIQSSIF